MGELTDVCLGLHSSQGASFHSHILSWTLPPLLPRHLQILIAPQNFSIYKIPNYYSLQCFRLTVAQAWRRRSRKSQSRWTLRSIVGSLVSFRKIRGRGR